MAEDTRLGAAADDVGLDYDPICQCQDPTDMRWNITNLALTSRAARVSVSLSWPGTHPAPPQKVALLLVQTPAGSPPRTPQACCFS